MEEIFIERITKERCIQRFIWNINKSEAHKNVMRELEGVRINPNLFNNDILIRNDLEFYIPRLCSFMLLVNPTINIMEIMVCLIFFIWSSNNMVLSINDIWFKLYSKAKAKEKSYQDWMLLAQSNIFSILIINY